MITQEILRKYYFYNPKTGNFFHLKTRAGVKIGGIAGCKDDRGYVKIGVSGKVYHGHRLAYLYMTGDWPECVDHINHDRSDNKWDNLRNVSHQENMKNQTISARNTAGITGVSYDKSREKWRAYTTKPCGGKYLGIYADKFDAICARKSAEYAYGFHANHGRV